MKTRFIEELHERHTMQVLTELGVLSFVVLVRVVATRWSKPSAF